MNWETILSIISHPATVTVICAIGGAAIAGFVKYKKAYKQLMDIPRAVLKARKAESDGGKKVTTEEYAAIGKEIVEFIEAMTPLFKKGR